jgi:uncharacterized membrane protein
MPVEALLVLLVLAVVLGVPLIALIMAIMAFGRARRAEVLARRVEELETTVAGLVRGSPFARGEEPARREAETEAPGPERAEEELVLAELAGGEEEGPPQRVPAAPRAAIVAVRPGRGPVQWEEFVGRKALGWVAVLVLVFAVAFFLRYAIQNEWIGPLGRVALGELGGIALLTAGWHYYRRGWRIFFQMLTAVGVIIIYLATYTAFGFYQLVPREAASVLLVVIVVESVLLALACNSLTVALAALLGGLMTPVLMQSGHDQYRALFTYLAVLDAGVLLVMLRRAWPAIGTVALLGTQALFWTWHEANYHPEKFAWALGFQAVVYVLFVAHSLGVHRRRPGRIGWEESAKLVLGAAFWFLAVYVFLKDDYGNWMGTAAVAMAAVYAAMARLMLTWRPGEPRPLLTALAVSVGFIALAFPIQADANWIALGWMAEAAALWWFGQRIEARPLRALAAALAGGSVMRVVFFDVPHGTREPFIPIFNDFALPALGVAVVLLAAMLLTRRFLPRLHPAERAAVGLTGAAGVLLLWFVLSIDCYGFFDALAAQKSAAVSWRWIGQMSLSIFWAMYATAVLAVGFRARQAWLRWMAIGLFGLTVAKVFLVDISQLEQIYRILTFFVLAIFLGIAAWAYQRIRIESDSAGTLQGDHHDSR